MGSRMNEDLAWLRVQDRQREVENRRLKALDEMLDRGGENGGS